MHTNRLSPETLMEERRKIQRDNDKENHEFREITRGYPNLPELTTNSTKVNTSNKRSKRDDFQNSKKKLKRWRDRNNQMKRQ